MNEAEIRQAILETPFAGDVEALMAGGQPALRLHAERVSLDDLALGASRLGGVPDLPSGMDWPCNGDWPLEMIAQINLADAAGCFNLPDLPASGWLVFFYEDPAYTPLQKPEPEGSRPWQVMYFDGAAESLIRLEPLNRPARLGGLIGWFLFGWPKSRVCFEPCAVRFEYEFRLIDNEDASFQVEYDAKNHDAWDEYAELLESIGHWSSETRHRLRGHDDTIQWPMRREAEETAREMGFTTADGAPEERKWDWELLLQIDTDSGPGWMWGDAGRIYFWIRRQDLAARDFSKACCILQSA